MYDGAVWFKMENVQRMHNELARAGMMQIQLKRHDEVSFSSPCLTYENYIGYHITRVVNWKLIIMFRFSMFFFQP